MKIYAMVTTKASWEYTSYAIKSFFRNTTLDGDDHLYLIDNDFGFEEDASWFSPALQILKNDQPLGFAANMNQVLQIAKAKQADFFVLQNDVIFTSEWSLPLLENHNAIVSSISNAHTETDIAGIEWSEVLKLNQYLGKEAKLKEIIKAHKEKSEGFKSVFTVPFFCLRIPAAVYQQVGDFDESFSIAGGEDHDYCLRAHKLGLDVLYSKKSLVLHFTGKSTWAGAERSEQTVSRKAHNQEVFQAKWGLLLKKLCLDNDISILDECPELKTYYHESRFKDLVEAIEQK